MTSIQHKSYKVFKRHYQCVGARNTQYFSFLYLKLCQLPTMSLKHFLYMCISRLHLQWLFLVLQQVKASCRALSPLTWFIILVLLILYSKNNCFPHSLISLVMEDTANSPSKPSTTSGSWVTSPFIYLVILGVIGVSSAIALQVCI